jgi:hypothetical protein
MTDMATTFGSKVGESSETPSSTSVRSAAGTQAVITEQQVLFSTAAAVALPPARTRRFGGGIYAVASAIGGWFASAAAPPKPVYPKRHVWLENALLSREMDRL